MATELEDLRILQTANGIADAIWKEIVRWDEFERDVVGNQLARAADSIGANIAESYSPFNHGEKVQCLYYARGSLFETKYSLNRVRIRQLIGKEEVEVCAAGLLEVARPLNSFVKSLNSQ